MDAFPCAAVAGLLRTIREGAVARASLGLAIFTVIVVSAAAQSMTLDPFYAPELRVSGGNVYAATVQSDGKLLIGGDFTWINGIRRPSLARLNTDGTVDTSFDGALDGRPVLAIALQPDGRIIVAGAFTAAGGVMRSRLARLDASGALDTSFASTAGVNGSARALALADDGSIFVGGEFTATTDGTARAGLVKFTSSGSVVTRYQPNLGSSSYGSPIVGGLLLMANGRLLVAGQFSSASGIGTGGLAMLDASGALDSAWTLRASGLVSAVLARDSLGRIYANVTGYSNSSTWPFGRSVVRFSADLVPDTTWSIFTSATITALLPLANGEMLVAGSQVSASGSSIQGPLTRYLSDGTRDATYTVGLSPGVVNALASAGGAIYAVGSTNNLGNDSAVCSLDTRGALVRPWLPRFQSLATLRAAVAQPDGKTIIAGNFDAIGAYSANGLARLTVGGRLDRTFRAPAGLGSITALLRQSDGHLLVRRQQNTNSVCRLNSDGSLDGTYNANGPSSLGSDAPWGLRSDDKLVIAYSGQLYRFNTSGIQEAIAPNSIYSASFLDVQPDNHIVIGGSFYTAGPAQRDQRYLARLNPDGSFDATFISPLKSTSTSYYYSTPITALRALADGRLLVAGPLSWLDNSSAGFARLTSVGERDAGFASTITATDRVTAVLPRTDGGAVVAGYIGSASRVRVVQASGAFDANVDAAISGASAVVNALTSANSSEAIIGGQFMAVAGVARNSMARLSTQSAFAALPERVSAAAGATLTLVPQLGANLGAAYQWQLNGTPVPGGTNSTLTLGNFAPGTQVGNYTLVVTNGAASFETDPVEVSVDAAPVITTQPSAVIEDAGGTAVFRVVATGSPAPSFAWKKDGVAISGATDATLKVGNVDGSDAGLYSVSVTNRAGSVTSSEVSLTIRTLALDRQFNPVLIRDVAQSIQQLFALPDGRIFAQGSFNALDGKLVASPVAIAANGQVDQGFNAEYVGTPLALLSDGRILVFGASYYNGSSWVYPLRLLDRSGRIVAGFAVDVSNVNSLRVFETGGALLFANSGTLAVGGVNLTSGIARIRLDGTLDTGFSVSPVAGAQLYALGATSDGKLYLSYTEYSGGIYTWHFLRTSSTGALDPTFNSPTVVDSNGYYAPQGLVQGDGRLVIGTTATTAGPQSLKRFNLDGSTDSAFRDSLPRTSSGEIWRPLAVYPDGSLLISGTNSHWWRLQSSGARDLSFDIADASSFRVAAVLSDSSILAWSTYDPAASVRRYDSSGQAIATGVPHFGVKADITAVAYQAGGSIYVAGNFDWVNGVRCRAITRLLPSGQIDGTFSSAIATDESISSLAVQSDGRPVLAGSLRRASSDSVSYRVLRLQWDGARDLQYGATFDAAIRDVVSNSDDSVVVGGDFSIADGIAASRVARLTSFGAVDVGFTAPFQTDTISSLITTPDGKVVAAYSGVVNYSTISTVRRLLSTGAADNTWSPATLSGAMTDLALNADGSVVGFGTAGGVRFLTNGEIDPSYVVTPLWSGSVTTVLSDRGSGKLAVGGNFSSINGILQFALARLQAGGELDFSFQPRLANGFNAPAVASLARRTDGDLLAGGAFSSVDGLSCTGLARWSSREFAITFSSSIRTLTAGESAALTMSVQGSGPFTYQWRKDGIDVPGGTDASLALANVGQTAAGVYTLRVSNGRQTQDSDGLRVAVAQPPTITSQPSDLTVYTGAAAQFSVGVTASPSPSFQWFKDGVAIDGARGQSLLLPHVSRRDARLYSVTVTNTLGTASSAGATLVVTGAQLDEGFVPSFVITNTNAGSRSLINAAIQLADGRWLIGGGFQTANGVLAPFIARLTTNGNVDPTYDAPGVLTDPVRSFTRLDDGTIMVGAGLADGYYNAETTLAVRLRADGTLDNTFAPVVGAGSMTAFARNGDGSIYAGGDFVLGTARGLVRLTSTGALDATFSTTLNSDVKVSGLVLLGGDVIAAVNPRYSYGGDGHPLRRFRATGQVDATWAPMFARASSYDAPFVTSIALTDAGKVLVAGRFAKIATTDCAGIAQLNADGSVDTNFAADVKIGEGTNPVLVKVSGGRFVVSGIAEQPGTVAIRLAADGRRECVYALAGQPMAAAVLCADPTGQLLVLPAGISGYYYSSDSEFPTLLRFGADGSIGDSIALRLDGVGRVACIAPMPDGRLVVAGEFSDVNGQPRIRVARLLPGGAADPGFVPAILPTTTGYSTPTISAMVVQADGRVVLAGTFSSFNGAVRNHILRLDSDGAIDALYNPAPDARVSALALDATQRVVVAGDFSNIGGGSARRVARLKTDGALDTSFQPQLPSDVSSVQVVAVAPDGKVLYSGSRSSSGTGFIIRLLASGAADTTFVSPPFAARAISVLSDGRVAALSSNQVQLFATNGTADPNFGLNFRNASGYTAMLANMLVQADGRLVVAGDFTSVNGQPKAGVVRLFNDARIDPSFYPGSGAKPVGSINAIAQQPDGAVVLGGNFTRFDGTAAGGLVRLVNRSFFVRIRQPEVLVASGATAALAVDAIGAGAFSYVWKHGGSVVAGATASTLSIAGAAAGDAGQYVCEVTSGGATIVSDPITLTLGSPPSFTVHPAAVQTAPGTAVTLSAAASGSGTISYQWYRNTVAIADATATTLAISNATTSDSAIYFVTASNSFGRAISRLASVLIGVAPTITAQPADTVASEGGSLFLSIGISGAPSPVVQWRRNGVDLPNATNNYYTKYAVSTADAGTYSAYVANPFGAVTSATCRVAINPSTPTAPAIQTQPASMTGSFSTGFSFSVIATGNPAPTYQWRHDGVAVAGATNSTYSKYPGQASDAGNYDVVVANGSGSVTSSTAVLTLQQAPYFSDTPQSYNVAQGGTVTFSARVVALPAPTLQWQKDGAPIAGATESTFTLRDVTSADEGQYRLVATNSLGSATSSSGSLHVLTTVQRGLFSGIVRANANASGVTATFTVEGALPKRMLLRAIGPTLAKLGVAGSMNDPMMVLTDASGAYVAHNNNWADAANAAEVASVVSRIGATALATSSSDAAILVTVPPGTYTATIAPADGASGVVLVEMYEADAVPRLVRLTLRAPAGAGTAALSFGFYVIGSVDRLYLIRALGPILGGTEALADPRLALFYSSGAQIATNDDWGADATNATFLRDVASRVGATSLPAGSKDAALLAMLSPGSYVAQVTAPAGTSGEVAIEIVEADTLREGNQRPAFIFMPTSRDVPIGGTLTLAATAIGTPSPAYQWSKDGTAIVGATDASLTVTNFQAGDAGAYVVAATNGVGSATSLPATIAVGTGLPPAATHSVVGGVYAPGASVTVSNTLVYSGSATSVAWSATLPAGWTYAGGSGEGDVKPAVGATGTVEWTWTTPPPSPITFTYRVNVPGDAFGTKTVGATASIRTATTSIRTVSANPSLLPIVPASALHSADTDHDFRISLLELTRVIELYNTRAGTTRTGCYSVQPGSEDGFAPDPTRSNGTTVALSAYHAADSNHDGKIGLVELTRIIELYNYRSGTSRTGQYHVQIGTEDGFAPAP